MKQSLTRYLLLQKRMLRRKSYLVMVLSVLLFIAALKGISMQDSGMATVVIYVEDGADATAVSFAEGFHNMEGIILYEFVDSEEAALLRVQDGTADEAWMIPANMQSLVDEYSNTGKLDTPITVYVREQNVIHYFLKEILQAHFFRHTSVNLLNSFSLEKIGISGLDPNEYVPDGNLFQLYNIGESDAVEQLNYNLMPLRGFLALWLLISSIASSMYYIYDCRNGLFIYWNTKSPFLREFLYHFLTIFDSMIIALIGLWVGGVFTDWRTELVSAFIYCIILVLFAMLLEKVMKSEKVIGVFTPVMITFAAIFSPVFVDLRSYKILQNLVPSFHYLKSTFDCYYIRGAFLYILCLLAILSFTKGREFYAISKYQRRAKR